ncbi:MAG: hypothetical protein IPK32_01825 [Verrucomicrobiaceae bacterium]|nr:hypothetical protein [Verrucomicrobiaceae bacterium]
MLTIHLRFLMLIGMFLSSCAVQPYGTGVLNETPRIAPAYTPLYSQHNSNVEPTRFVFATRHVRPYYANYGWGRPYYGSTWYAMPYSSQWRNPGYTRYQEYGSPTTSYAVPMRHYGGWSYVYRPSHQQVVNGQY